MGKKMKKSDIKLSDQELIPSTIGYMEDEKTGPWGLIILFAIFIGVAFFLPEITDFGKKLLGKTDPTTMVPVDGNQEDPGSGNVTPDKPKTDSMHDFSEDLTFTYDDIKFSDFSKIDNNGKYKLSFVMENSTTEDIDLTSNKYFIEIYNDNTMLGRHIIDLDEVKKTSKISYSTNLNVDEYNNLSKLLLVKKSLNDYSEFTLTTTAGDNYILTCNNSNSNLVYTFNSKYTLIKIKDTLQVSSEEPDYSSILTEYKLNASEYNNISGVASNILESESGFVMTTDIETSKANIDNLNNKMYYSTKAEAKDIKFEMESRGYSCN